MCHTSICIGGNFEWLVYEWVPIIRAQIYEWGGFWRCRAAPPYQNDPLVTPEVTIDVLSQFDAIYLRNKFHFSEVHGSMNATGHVQIKWRPYLCTGPVAFILPWTSEKRNSSLIFTFCFYIVFVHYLWNFGLNLGNERRRKVITRRVSLLRSTAVTMIWRQSNVTMANQLLHLSMTSLTRNVAWMRVVHGCTNLVGPK